MRLPLLVVVFVSFTALEFYIVRDRPFFEYLTLAWNDPWGGAMFLDLAMALTLFFGWAWRDAAARKLPFFPYALAAPFLGSISALAYLVHREVAARRAAAPGE